LGGKLLEYANKILQEALKGVGEAAVLVVESKSVMLKLYNSQPSTIQSWRRVTTNLYLNKNGRIATFSMDAPTLEEALKCVQEAFKRLSVIEVSEYNVPLPEPDKPEPLREAFDARVSRLVDDPGPLVEAVFDGLEELERLRSAGMVRAGVRTKALVTSRGFEGEESGTFIDGYIRAFGSKTSGQWAFTTTTMNEELLREAFEKACYYASLDLPQANIASGRYNVILSPMVAGNLLNLVAMVSGAMAVDLGFSFLAKYNIGDVIASEDLSLYDVPRGADLPGATGFDDEGVRTFNKPIIESGVLRNLLHNSKTAAKRNTKSTANAGWLIPHPWSLDVPAGDLKEEELIRELKEGLVFTNNWYTRLQNYIEGEFSTVARDATIYVKNGEPAGLVSGARIADTLPRLLKNIKGLANKRYPIQWWEVETPIMVPYLVAFDTRVTKT